MLITELIKEVRGRPLLLIGDFNYPDIDWSTLQASSSASRLFIDCLDDAFLIQHVTEPIRKGSVLDLVITSEPDMIDTVNVLGCFSDHRMLQWNMNVLVSTNGTKRQSFDYSKGDYAAIRQELMKQDWDAVLRGNVNEQWNKFRSLLERLEQQYISSKCIDDSKHKKAAWLSYKAVKSVRRKHKVYTKYKK